MTSLCFDLGEDFICPHLEIPRDKKRIIEKGVDQRSKGKGFMSRFDPQMNNRVTLENVGRRELFIEDFDDEDGRKKSPSPNLSQRW